MNYLSVCSGVEAATVAWHELGWKPVGFSEIEKFPSAVLQHHYPQVTNYGDMTKYKEWNINESVELLVGGTPCQSFSVAGLRKGLEDPRGNLALTYVGILDRFRPKWFIWENVPGVLSSNGGRDFGSFLGAVVECGYGFAYRVLDAQYFGVPQRRRRVFVVGCLGDWESATSILFKNAINKAARLEKTDHLPMLTTQGGGLSLERLRQCVFDGNGVRYLTALERERLQGFPDNWTNIPWRNKSHSPPGQRYKAMGNSMAVPCMRWLGQRIEKVEHGLL
jgi:DNA (cytosine-5)-methyltransferase 1